MMLKDMPTFQIIPPEDAHQVQSRVALGEVIAERHRIAGERLHHHDAVPDEVGEQQADAEQHNGRVGAQLAGFQIGPLTGSILPIAWATYL